MTTSSQFSGCLNFSWSGLGQGSKTGKLVESGFELTSYQSVVQNLNPWATTALDASMILLMPGLEWNTIAVYPGLERSSSHVDSFSCSRPVFIFFLNLLDFYLSPIVHSPAPWELDNALWKTTLQSDGWCSGQMALQCRKTHLWLSIIIPKRSLGLHSKTTPYFILINITSRVQKRNECPPCNVARWLLSRTGSGLSGRGGGVFSCLDSETSSSPADRR